MIAALSQVSFVSGFGSSCSHELLEKRPSRTDGSRRNMISRSRAAASPSSPSAPSTRPPSRRFNQSPFNETVFLLDAVLETNPSLRELLQNCSKSDLPYSFRQ